jgi:hypothetical protein
MASLFDDLDDLSELDYNDPDLEALRMYVDNAWSSSKEGDYLDNSDEEDPYGGPDIEDPEPPGHTAPPSVTSSVTSSTTSSTTSLPLYQPAPIRPPITASMSALTIQAIEAAILKDPVPIKKRGHTIGARVFALALLDCGSSYALIFKQTGMTESGVRKLKVKAVERGWVPGVQMVVQVEHVEDRARSRRPGTSQEIIQLILKIVTRNSTTRGWSCARIAQEVYDTEGITPKEVPSASTVYRILKKQGYSVYKRTVKPGLNQKQKDARLAWCLQYEHWDLED